MLVRRGLKLFFFRFFFRLFLLFGQRVIVFGFFGGGRGDGRMGV